MDDDDAVVWTQDQFEGRYANCFRVGFNVFELLIDFAQYIPDSRVAVQHTRIIVNPAYGKILLGLLSDSIEQYELTHGHNL
jgi:uncharacterized protein DUF3467